MGVSSEKKVKIFGEGVAFWRWPVLIWVSAAQWTPRIFHICASEARRGQYGP